MNVFRGAERVAMAATMPDLSYGQGRHRRNGRVVQVQVRSDSSPVLDRRQRFQRDRQQTDQVHRVRNAGVFLLLWPAVLTGSHAVCSFTSMRLPCAFRR